MFHTPSSVCKLFTKEFHAIYIYREVRFVTTDGGTVLVEACQHSDNISLMRDKPECGPEQCAASAEAQPLA